ncbi:MAG TPA: DNA primase [Rubricoccaceae bacterium]
MAGIPDAIKDEVRAASDLVDVIGERVVLKKQGRRFLGLCPFHNEKSPSFSVVPDEGFFYCFGCKKTGDVFSFVQETEGVGFLDAVRLLAARAGIALPEENSPAADRQGTLHAALRFAAGYFVEQLRNDAGKRARAYLAERAFTKEAVLAFGLGFAPEGWDGLATAATAAGFDPDVLEAVGLVRRRENGGIYDVFRDRLVFPILSPIGKVLGFAGRILPDSRTASADYTPAKYLNTPETEVYHKSRVLFGMKQAKRAIRASGEAIVVEGHADVVALWQAGVENVVAASGTALTAQQLDSLARAGTTRVVLLFDADSAGQSAARKGVETALDAGLTPYCVNLPDGADPDSFVRTFGSDAFRTVLRDERRSFVDFLVLSARRDGLFETPEGKREAVDRVVSAVARVQDSILAEEYVRRAARALDVVEPEIRREVDLRSRRPSAPEPAMRSVDVRRTRQDPAIIPNEVGVSSDPGGAVAIVRPKEETLLRLMLHVGIPMVEHVMTRMGLDEFSEGAARETVEVLLAQFEAGAVDAQPFLRGAHGTAVQELVGRILAPQHDVSQNWSRAGIVVPGEDAEPFAVATGAMRRLKMERLLDAVEDARRRLLAAERSGPDGSDGDSGPAVAAIQAEIVGLNRLRQQIERGDFLTWDASEPVD